jgi:hypothetical protein
VPLVLCRWCCAAGVVPLVLCGWAGGLTFADGPPEQPLWHPCHREKRGDAAISIEVPHPAEISSLRSQRQQKRIFNAFTRLPT